MTPTILIVDDEPDLREAIAFDYRRKKFNVLLAASGNEAIQILEKEKVDIVVSDVRMPDGDGLKLLDTVKAKNAFFPVVLFITGYADISVEEAYDRGVEAVFAKPFDRHLLMATVLRAIEPIDQRLSRKSSRIEVDFKVGLKFAKSGYATQTIAKNMGRGGISVEIEQKIPEINEKVEFRLEAAQRPNLVIDGEGIVRWVRKISESSGLAGCGIEFVGLDKNCITQVVELVNFLKTKSFIPKS
jgi:CheY-like chemotaxis protein